ncbi:ABC transporter ATP-binding protein [Photobacterium pectinilyticum]|uniref:ABC transporter ATP-binding protein n=1 Tax=Photobacterium pectinilyticum TaxID=2906793 RepID=UPI0023643E72|nr:ABC transporter ATP-binding protein [Photobacterium sp. ZSDE20]
MNKIVELKNVGVSYNERKSLFKSTKYHALKDITFDIFKGETLGIIGRNGAGKSTLLRLLAGIIEPDKGVVKYHTNSVSLMALQAGFDSNLSGRQNAVISGMLLGYRKSDVVSQLEDIKNFSELGEFFEKPIKTYSSGMKAKLGFSIAMFTSPDILLIDEVLGVGDVRFRQKAEMAIAEKVASDITVVIVSHSEHQVSSLAERIVWIENGVVRKVGTAKEVYPEFNLNVVFSSNNDKITKLWKKEDCILIFEKVRRAEEHFYFNCVVIDKNNKKITKVLCENEFEKIELPGPTDSPAFHKKFPEHKYSHKSRFHDGQIKCKGMNELFAIIDGEKVKVLEIEFKQN